MAEYIEREAAIEALRQSWPNTSVMEDNIRRIPAADVRPVVHGKWIFQAGGESEFDAGDFYLCSNCGAAEFEEPNYCPNCGAKMDGRTDNG